LTLLPAPSYYINYIIAHRLSD